MGFFSSLGEMFEKMSTCDDCGKPFHDMRKVRIIDARKSGDDELARDLEWALDQEPTLCSNCRTRRYREGRL